MEVIYNLNTALQSYTLQQNFQQPKNDLVKRVRAYGLLPLSEVIEIKLLTHKNWKRQGLRPAFGARKKKKTSKQANKKTVSALFSLMNLFLHSSFSIASIRLLVTSQQIPDRRRPGHTIKPERNRKGEKKERKREQQTVKKCIYLIKQNSTSLYWEIGFMWRNERITIKKKFKNNKKKNLRP